MPQKARLRNVKARPFACQLNSRPLPPMTVLLGNIERSFPSYESLNLAPHQDALVDLDLLEEPAISGALKDGWLRVLEVVEAPEESAPVEAVEADASEESAPAEAVATTEPEDAEESEEDEGQPEDAE